MDLIPGTIGFAEFCGDERHRSAGTRSGWAPTRLILRPIAHRSDGLWIQRTRCRQSRGYTVYTCAELREPGCTGDARQTWPADPGSDTRTARSNGDVREPDRHAHCEGESRDGGRQPRFRKVRHRLFVL